jgi:hypothetical protein
MKQLLTLLMAVACLTSANVAFAQVRQPDGTTVPTRTSGDGPSVGDVLTRRGETNLVPPMTPYNAQANARPDPQTFRPGCRISFTVIARYAGHYDSFGWYNVVPGRMTPPPVSERYMIVPAASMETPAARGGVGFTATLDIGADTRYTGGEIGFFLNNTTQENTYFTERRYQPGEVPGYFYAVIYDSRVTPGGFYFAWEDLIRGNDNDFNDLIVLVDNLTCTGGGGVCSVPGARGACASGTLQCRNAELVCIAQNVATPERCDDIDNDCNGTVDDGNLCPPRQVCERGLCVDRCEIELGCPGGFTCVPRGACVENACLSVTCPAGSICRGGMCRAACAGIVCPRGQVCRQDRCVDPCAGLTCDRDQVCVAGVCQPRCPCRRCGTGEVCSSEGVCRQATCASVTCPTGSVCDNGRCVDTCIGAVCPGGGRCTDGRCTPPVGIDAATPPPPTDASMVDVELRSDIVRTMDNGPVDTGVASGEQGCGCHAGSTTTHTPWWALALSVVALRRRISARRDRSQPA